MFEFIIKIFGTKEIDLTKYVNDALPRYVLKIMYEVQHGCKFRRWLFSLWHFAFALKKRLFEHLSENLDLWRQYYYMYKSGYWIRHRCLNVSLRHFIPTFVDSLTNQSYFVFISNFLYTWKYLSKIFASNLILKRFQI